MPEVKAISSLGVKLLKASTKAGPFSELCRIKDFPDLIGTPNLIDVTDLQDTQQANINGIMQSDTKTFTANYTKETYDDVALEEREDMFFALQLSDKSGWVWPGQFTLGVPGKGVDEAIEFSVNITSTGDVERVSAINVGTP